MVGKMYRPPENANRVQAIRSIFESKEVTAKLQGPPRLVSKSKTELDIRYSKCHQNLNRQLSDPSKRNIKRTPAFRLDKNAIIEKNSSRYHLKAKNDCDKAKHEDPTFSDTSSKSNRNQSDSEKMTSTNVKNISFLYAQPIPKALRIAKCDTVSSECDENFCNNETLKLKDDNVSLTDTLKSALKKPLPAGPAPKKPPRTFLHSPQTPKTSPKPPSEISQKRGKGDPKYMLDKLENMLRTNQRRTKKSDSVTSGEDSDDNSLTALFPPRNPLNTSNTLPSNGRFNLNCLNALGCGVSDYERVKEPTSSFFVDCQKEEPVYAEPFQFKEGGATKETRKQGREQRSSLYYMSSPILQPHENMNASSPEKSQADDPQEKQVVARDTSSLSSAYTSDAESAEEGRQQSQTPRATKNNKIKDIIQVFELRSGTTHQQKSCGKGADRIKELEHQLRKTLDRTFADKMNATADVCSDDNSCSCCSATESGHEDAKDDITNKFETYVRTVRIYTRPGVKRDEHLFDCCLLVGLNKRTPYIKMKFPENVEIPAKIEQLCFPDGIDGPMDRSDRAQCYSLVMTNEHGVRTFGYCRRILPEGSENCLPLAYCILSKHRAPRFYKRILEELESRHGLPDKLRDALLSEFYYRQFPRPGESIKVDLTKIRVSMESEVISVNNNGVGSCGKQCEGGDNLDLKSYVIVNNNGEYGTLKRTPRANGVELRKPVRGQSAFINLESTTTTPCLKRCASSPSLDKDVDLPPKELILALHQDSRYEETGVKDLHSILNTSILQKVFASLLLERKIILVSCVLSKLSSCVEALQSILYPFCWPHTLIPVLPQSLWEIVEAPTPFVCGVLSVAFLNMYRIDNALVVDLDVAAVLSEVGDEDKILPSALVKTWKSGLSVAKSVPACDSAHSVLLSDAYLRVFIHCCGHYKDYIVNGVFQKEPFIQHLKGKGLRRFLTWFTETTMFCSFLEQVQNDPSSYAIFDKRIQIYGSEESDIILEKMKDWKKEKTLGSFFK